MEEKQKNVQKEQIMVNVKRLIAIVEDIELSMNGETQLWPKEKGA